MIYATQEWKRFEQSETGACFPMRPYYPMRLVNGVDAIFVNIAGYTDTPEAMKYSGALPARSSYGWYKTARKDYLVNEQFGSAYHYGLSPALAVPTVSFGIGKETKAAVRRPKQVFNPDHRVITTELDLVETRGKIPAKLRVTTFLTDEHILVEHYELLQAPESGFRLGIRLDTPRNSDMHALPVQPVEVKYEAFSTGFGFAYHYASPEIPDGIAATWTDVEADDVQWSDGRPTVQWTPYILQGQSVTHYTAVVDAWDVSDPKQEIARLQQKTLERGYEALLREHVEAVRPAAERARVHLPEKDLQYLYDYSHYVVDACFDKATGFLPNGITPALWQNAMFWDAWYVSVAWLGSNCIEKSRKIAEYYRHLLPEAQELAKKLDSQGARYAWTTNRNHFEAHAEDVLQFHNNAVVALQTLQVYLATGDREFLKESFDVVEQSLLFLTDKLVSVDEDGLHLRACAGIDESTADLKKTDTWTAGSYLKALKLYLQACRDIDRQPFREGLEAYVMLMHEALLRNIDEDGVLQSFDGGVSPNDGSMVFYLLFPDFPGQEKTLDALSVYDEEFDAYYSQAAPHVPMRISPWAEFRLACVLAESENPRGWERLKQTGKFTDCYGSFPEGIFYHGELYKLPFLPAHGSYLWAVQSLLVHRKGEKLSIFNNVPKHWDTLSVENITTLDGLNVSAKMNDRKVDCVRVVNQNQIEKEVVLVLPNEESRRLILKPGEVYQ